MKYDLVVFDLDGTVLNTLDDLADSVNYVLAQHALPLHTTEEIKYMVGNGIPKLIQRALPESTSQQNYEQFLREFAEYYANHCDIKTKPYDGIIECLQKLKSAGIKIAVNTNKLEPAAITLCKKHFPKLFDVICGSKNNLPVKPAPDGVYEIEKKLFSENAITNQHRIKGCYVGDSDVDIATGKNCGFDQIGVAWGFRGEKFLRENGASVVVKNATELENALL